MESSNLVRQKNCLVMAAASAVQAAREQSGNGEEKVWLRFKLQQIRDR